MKELAPKIQWLTTYPSGRAHTHGADDGQTGWRIHAVLASNAEKLPLKGVSALCGLIPRHGWGMDLFIDRKCANCERMIVGRLCADAKQMVNEIFEGDSKWLKEMCAAEAKQREAEKED